MDVVASHNLETANLLVSALQRAEPVKRDGYRCDAVSIEVRTR